MDEYIRQVLAALSEFTNPGLVWRNGLMHRGGPHYRVSISVSIGADECRVFGKLIETFRPRDGFIVGNAFGYSCAIIALAMRDHGGETLITLDPRTEGDGERCAAIANELLRRLNLNFVKNKKGYSPQDIPGAVEKPKYDLIFIDGLHAHPQVTKDFDGCEPYGHDKTVFVWHDYWLEGIPECIDHAKSKGYLCWYIPTSCEMVVGTRDPETFKKFKELFPNGAEDGPKRSKLEHLRMGAYALTCRETSRFVHWIKSGRKKELLNA